MSDEDSQRQYIEAILLFFGCFNVIDFALKDLDKDDGKHPGSLARYNKIIDIVSEKICLSESFSYFPKVSMLFVDDILKELDDCGSISNDGNEVGGKRASYEDRGILKLDGTIEAINI